MVISNPDGTIGYGAVIMSHLDEFQGFFLVQNEAVDREAVKMQMMALATQPEGIHGALQAVIVEGVVTKRWDVVAAGARALWGITKEPYFYIEATKEGGGTRTQMHVLKARSVEAAQIEVNHLPQVLEIKERLLATLQKRKQ
jgi:hypothetical protein